MAEIQYQRSNFGSMLRDLCRSGRTREAQKKMLDAYASGFDPNADRICRISIELGDPKNAHKFFNLMGSKVDANKRTIEQRCAKEILSVLTDHTGTLAEPNWLNLKAKDPGDRLNVILTGEVQGATRLDYFNTAEILLKGMSVIDYSRDDIRSLSGKLAAERSAQRQRLSKSIGTSSN